MKQNKKARNIIIIGIALLIGVFLFINKKAKSQEVEVILFHAPGCQYCYTAIDFLDTIEDKYPDLKITKHNTNTSTGARYYAHYTKKLNIPSKGVPLAVFGDKYELGFGGPNTTGKLYITHIDNMLKATNKK